MFALVARGAGVGDIVGGDVQLALEEVASDMLIWLVSVITGLSLGKDGVTL